MYLYSLSVIKGILLRHLPNSSSHTFPGGANWCSDGSFLQGICKSYLPWYPAVVPLTTEAFYLNDGLARIFTLPPSPGFCFSFPQCISSWLLAFSLEGTSQSDFLDPFLLFPRHCFPFFLSRQCHFLPPFLLHLVSPTASPDRAAR